MSDFHETALSRYEEEQDQLAKEEREREENPTFHWIITQKNPKTGEVWEDYCNSYEETMALVDEAVKDGHEYEWAKYTDTEYPA